jgi:glycosyltransferase involved in cell wall biosynthesis
VSVVVASAGRVGVLLDCLERLVRQSYPRDRYEIIVVENGVDGERSAEIRAFADGVRSPAVLHLTLPLRDANSARNAGVAAARGDPICFVDDDSLPPPSWLGLLVGGALRNPSAGCLGGPVRPRFESKPPRMCSAHDLAGGVFDEGPDEREVGEVWGCNMALRRSALASVGPFREGMRYSQEWEWQQRLLRRGGTIVYVPDAWLWHRRLAADLGVIGLLSEFAQRGYTIGTVRRAAGEAVESGDVRRHLGRGLAALGHGLRAGCTRGLTEGVKQLGLAAGLAAGKRFSPTGPSEAGDPGRREA